MTQHARWTMPLIRRGLELRSQGLTYHAITVVFREYHDVHVSPTQMRRMLRRHGAVPQPHGNSWQWNFPHAREKASA